MGSPGHFTVKAAVELLLRDQSITVSAESNLTGGEMVARDDGDAVVVLAALDPEEARLGHSNIGFSRADWERGSPDWWYVSMYLHKAAFDLLFSAVGECKASRMHLVVSLKGYTSHHPMAPGTRAENLFLRPADPSETLGSAKLAKGYVSSIFARNTLHAIAPPPGPDPYASEDGTNTEIPAPALIPADPVAAAVVALTVNVEKLRTSLKWGAGLIFVALLFLVGSDPFHVTGQRVCTLDLLKIEFGDDLKSLSGNKNPDISCRLGVVVVSQLY